MTHTASLTTPTPVPFIQPMLPDSFLSRGDHTASGQDVSGSASHRSGGRATYPMRSSLDAAQLSIILLESPSCRCRPTPWAKASSSDAIIGTRESFSPTRQLLRHGVRPGPTHFPAPTQSACPRPEGRLGSTRLRSTSSTAAQVPRADISPWDVSIGPASPGLQAIQPSASHRSPRCILSTRPPFDVANLSARQAPRLRIAFSRLVTRSGGLTFNVRQDPECYSVPTNARLKRVRCEALIRPAHPRVDDEPEHASRDHAPSSDPGPRQVSCETSRNVAVVSRLSIRYETAPSQMRLAADGSTHSMMTIAFVARSAACRVVLTAPAPPPDARRTPKQPICSQRMRGPQRMMHAPTPRPTFVTVTGGRVSARTSQSAAARRYPSDKPASTAASLFHMKHGGDPD